MSNSFDEKTKTFLVACLVTGIDVSEEPNTFMKNLVNHINASERQFYAEGDEDGIIVHDQFDQPFLSLLYNGTRLTFNTFGVDEYTITSSASSIGFAILNIINYLQKNEYPFCPSILGSERNIFSPDEDNADEGTNAEDWMI